jgi:hypothetical protein
MREGDRGAQKRLFVQRFTPLRRGYLKRPLLAQLRLARKHEGLPVTGVMRTSYARNEFFSP